MRQTHTAQIQVNTDSIVFQKISKHETALVTRCHSTFWKSLQNGIMYSQKPPSALMLAIVALAVHPFRFSLQSTHLSTQTPAWLHTMHGCMQMMDHGLMASIDFVLLGHGIYL